MSVYIGPLFFFNIYYLHMDGNGKKNLRFGKKNSFSSSKTGESVGNAKQTIFLFLALDLAVNKRSYDGTFEIRGS